MKTMIVVASVAALVLAVDSASAAAKHHAASGAVAAPKQPIPYSQLDAYLKASPKQRASKDWWSEANASTGMSANTAATTPAMPADTMTMAAPGASTAAPNTMTPPDASAKTPPATDTTTTPDQGKGDMSNPATDKPH